MGSAKLKERSINRPADRSDCAALFGKRWFARTNSSTFREAFRAPDQISPSARFRIEDVRLTDPHLSVLAGFKKLELLRLEQAYPASLPSKDVSGPNDDQAVAQMLGYLHGLDRLEVLRLENFAFGDESSLAVTELPGLRILVVDDAAELTDDGLAALADCKNLEILNLDVGHRITSDGLRQLAARAPLGASLAPGKRRPQSR